MCGKIKWRTKPGISISQNRSDTRCCGVGGVLDWCTIPITKRQVALWFEMDICYDVVTFPRSPNACTELILKPWQTSIQPTSMSGQPRPKSGPKQLILFRWAQEVKTTTIWSPISGAEHNLELGSASIRTGSYEESSAGLQRHIGSREHKHCAAPEFQVPGRGEVSTLERDGMLPRAAILPAGVTTIEGRFRSHFLLLQVVYEIKFII